ncbi:MAG: AAA family ATPase [Oscillospiraceae bacterium]|nr:AAA family ATPase [Oscillospiraceae bacterium]
MDILSAKEARDYDAIIRESAALPPEQCSSAREAHAIGKAYEKKQAFTQSIPWYVQSFLLDPSDESFGMIAGVCLVSRQYAKLQEYLALPQADPDGYYYNAAQFELAFRTGASSDVQIAALERFLDIQYEESYMLRLAALYLEAGREKEAGRLCKKISRLFPDTAADTYASNLLSAIKEGSGYDYIRQNPWLEDEVFKHLTFDLLQPLPEDITIGEPKPAPAPAPRMTASAAENTAPPAPEKPAEPPKKEKEQKLKIAPLVEKSMKGVIGMESLKQPLNDIVSLLQLEKRKAKAGLNLQKNIRIYGPDGCGKTTAAFAACRALHSMGLIDDPVPVITDYDSLLCDSDDELHENIQNLFQGAENKCILIENIHEFDDANAYSVGLKILDQLTKAFIAANGAVMLIITGREQESQELLRKKRRFAELFMLEPVILGAYSIDELMQITDAIAANSSFVIEEDAKPEFRKKLENAAAQPDFAYARDIDGMLKSCIRNVANRLRDKRRKSDKEYYIITAADVESGGDAETVEELLNQLERMTGLNSVKEQVRGIVRHERLQRMKAEIGLQESGHGTLHMLFTGNAGTGKTTVARILGKIYKRLGVLPKGQLIECSRKDLISNIYGATDKQVSEKVKEAMGGILFIDEAYSLCRDDNDTYGKEAIETLLKEIEDHRDSFMVILAGYGPEMDTFLDKNQGLRSRIPTVINFEDYTLDEMVQIFKDIAKQNQMLLDIGTDGAIRTLIENRAKKKDFGNARGVRNVFEEVRRAQEARIAEVAEQNGTLSSNDFLIIKKEDITRLSGASDQQDHKTVQDYLNDLNALTGLASVKQQVNRIVATVQVNQAMKAAGMAAQGFGTLHMVFKGNAGTGKTTVARIIGNIYRELGVLSTGQMVECDRSSLVAGYVGQTTAKTKAKIEEALGGILFIDEAYALMQGGDNDFGKEAITELVADIENYRNNLCVIIAGYSKEMDQFLQVNQGLSSRFPNEIIFEDYTPDEMLSILHGMVRSKGMVIEDGCDPLLRELIAQRSQASDFGNARGIRNLVEQMLTLRNLRIAPMLSDMSMTPEQRNAMLLTVKTEDVQAMLA